MVTFCHCIIKYRERLMYYFSIWFLKDMPFLNVYLMLNRKICIETYIRYR